MVDRRARRDHRAGRRTPLRRRRRPRRVPLAGRDRVLDDRPRDHRQRHLRPPRRRRARAAGPDALAAGHARAVRAGARDRPGLRDRRRRGHGGLPLAGGRWNAHHRRHVRARRARGRPRGGAARRAARRALPAARGSVGRSAVRAAGSAAAHRGARGDGAHDATTHPDGRGGRGPAARCDRPHPRRPAPRAAHRPRRDRGRHAVAARRRPRPGRPRRRPDPVDDLRLERHWPPRAALQRRRLEPLGRHVPARGRLDLRVQARHGTRGQAPLPATERPPARPDQPGARDPRRRRPASGHARGGGAAQGDAGEPAGVRVGAAARVRRDARVEGRGGSGAATRTAPTSARAVPSAPCTSPSSRSGSPASPPASSSPAGPSCGRSPRCSSTSPR